MAGNPYLYGYTPYLAGYQAPPPAFQQFPQPYPQQVQQQAQPPQSQSTSGGIVWVTETEAINYVPSSGTAVALWLRDKPVIYLKSLDNMGKPMTVILDYQERTTSAPVSVPASGANDTAYALKSDLDALRAEFAPVLALVTPQKKEASGNGE